MNEYEVSVTFELFVQVKAKNKPGAVQRAKRHFVRVEKGKAVPVQAMMWAKKKGTFKVRRLS